MLSLIDIDDEEKILIIQKLSAKITVKVCWWSPHQEKRSQLENKGDAVAKLNQLFVSVFTPRKKKEGY